MKNNRHPRLDRGSIQKHTAGVSLVIAIIFVAALLLVMAGLFEVRLRVIQSLGNRETEAKARYLAQSAEELASFWAATHGVGRNTAEETSTAMAAFLGSLYTAANDLLGINCADMDANPATPGPFCVDIRVESRAVDTQQVTFSGSPYYSVPTAKSGNAAEVGVNCDATPLTDADNPCHWNRLYVGKTVEIPLYYEDAAGSVTKLDFGAGSLEEFRLRVRTPACIGSSGGCDGGRLTLYPSVTASDYRDLDRDPVLVQWSIFDGDGSGVITAWDLKDGDEKRLVFRTLDLYAAQNTEISAGRVNLAHPSVDLSASDPIDDFTVLQYLNSGTEQYKNRGKNLDKQPQTIGSAILSYDQPTLRLSLVGQPQRNIAQDGTSFTYPASLNERAGFDIPYLEYQLLTKEEPPADEKSLIIGWAEIGGFRKEFRKYLNRQTSVSGFAIESF